MSDSKATKNSYILQMIQVNGQPDPVGLPLPGIINVSGDEGTKFTVKVKVSLPFLGEKGRIHVEVYLPGQNFPPSVVPMDLPDSGNSTEEDVEITLPSTTVWPVYGFGYLSAWVKQETTETIISNVHSGIMLMRT